MGSDLDGVLLNVWFISKGEQGFASQSIQAKWKL